MSDNDIIARIKTAICTKHDVDRAEVRTRYDKARDVWYATATGDSDVVHVRVVPLDGHRRKRDALHDLARAAGVETTGGDGE